MDSEFVLTEEELAPLQTKYHLEGVNRQLRQYLETDFNIPVIGQSHSDYEYTNEEGETDNGNTEPNTMILAGPEIRPNNYETRIPVTCAVGYFDNGKRKKVKFPSNRSVDLVFTLTTIRDSHFDMLDDIETWLLWFYDNHKDKSPNHSKKLSDWMEFDTQMYQVKEELSMSPENIVNFSNLSIAKGTLVVKRVILVNTKVYEIIGVLDGPYWLDSTVTKRDAVYI